MIDVASHVRIFDPNPADDLVSKRMAAVKDIASRFCKKQEVSAIFQLANDLAQAVDEKGVFSQELTQEVETSIKKSAKAFVADGHDLEVMVCGLLGALQALDGAQSTGKNLTIHDVFAMGLWLAFSFQPARQEPRIEALRTELLRAAQEHTLSRATSTRRRLKVPDASFDAPEEFNAANVAKSCNEGISSTIDALRANAAVDREEIDLLWWVLSDWSELLGRRFSGSDNPAALAVASGLEAGPKLRRMPSDAHYHLVLRHVENSGPLNLSSLIKALGQDREKLASSYADVAIVTACPAVFPLLAALRSGGVADSKSRIKRPLEEWAGRALLERVSLHITAHLPSVSV